LPGTLLDTRQECRASGIDCRGDSVSRPSCAKDRVGALLAAPALIGSRELQFGQRRPAPSEHP